MELMLVFKIFLGMYSTWEEKIMKNDGSNNRGDQGTTESLGHLISKLFKISFHMYNKFQNYLFQ